MDLQSAITNFNLIEISYNSLKEEKTNRLVEPFALYSTQENWLLVAFCRLRNEFRVFRLDRILKLVIKNERFDSHRITLKEYFDTCASNL